MDYQERAATFRRFHSGAPLVLPNAWDAGSARVIEHAGAQAIATTSAGMAWAHGYPDGQRMSWEEMLQALRAIVRAVTIPVTADIEGGYGTSSSADIAETVRAVIDAGVVGIDITTCNLEKAIFEKNPTIQEPPPWPEDTVFPGCKCAETYSYDGNTYVI